MKLRNLNLLLLFSTFFALPVFAQSDASVVISSACQASADPIACASNHPLIGSGGFITNIVGVLIYAVGAISVIMIVIGGLRYTLSGGDSAGVKSAKDTIMYALVGLAVSILAYTIVQFVIGRVG